MSLNEGVSTGLFESVVVRRFQAMAFTEDSKKLQLKGTVYRKQTNAMAKHSENASEKPQEN